MSSKQIYSFQVPKKTKKEVVEVDGDTKITKLVDGEELVTIVLKKPSRQEAEQAEWEYAKQYGDAVRAGLVTKALILKMYDKEGYIEDKKGKVLDKTTKLREIQLEYQSLHLKEDKTEDDKLRLAELKSGWEHYSLEVQDIELELESIFENTAENLAQKKVITWLTLFVTQTEDSAGTLRPFFKGDTYEDKLKHSDAMLESENEFFGEVITKASFLTGLWYLGKATTAEDFDAILGAMKPTPSELVEENGEAKAE